jgi:hypothetical protein
MLMCSITFWVLSKMTLAHQNDFLVSKLGLAAAETHATVHVKQYADAKRESREYAAK